MKALNLQQKKRKMVLFCSQMFQFLEILIIYNRTLTCTERVQTLTDLFTKAFGLIFLVNRAKNFQLSKQTYNREIAYIKNDAVHKGQPSDIIKNELEKLSLYV